MKYFNGYFFLSFVFILLNFSVKINAQETEGSYLLPLGELSDSTGFRDVSVVSASNTRERLRDAPATVIILTQNDLRERGYNNMLEIFEDLPGMDIVRTYGDQPLKVYWRGWRSHLGHNWVLMIDGLIYNTLYHNDNDAILPAHALSNIERIEVVYGPSSSVYGANAMMGIINVITIKNKTENGIAFHGSVFTGSHQSHQADLNLFGKRGKLRFSLTGRFDIGKNDLTNAEKYEWTKSKYYADTRLWGDFANFSEFGGDAHVPYNNRSLDARIFWKNTEIGGQIYQQKNGWGYIYSADRFQAANNWAESNGGFYIRHLQQVQANISSTSLLRYRFSYIDNDSWELRSITETDQDGNPYRAVRFGYWQALNYELSFKQDFQFDFSQRLRLNTGFRYVYRNLNKAWERSNGQFVNTDSAFVNTYPYPEPPSPEIHIPNRAYTEGLGIYGQVRFRLTPETSSNHHFLHTGFRLDNDSFYGTAPTIRLGYVGNFNKIGLKLLYGTAYQEPTPRSLYGSWEANGSNKKLKPQDSYTVEFAASYHSPKFRAVWSTWFVDAKNTIVAFTGGAKNAGSRTMYGTDAHAEYLWNLEKLQFKIWGFYSFVIGEEVKFDENEINIGRDIIGDLAKHKFYFGISGTWQDKISTSLRGRIVGNRETIQTNPLKEISGYTVLDFNLKLRNVLGKGVHLFSRVNNLLNTEYYHPGINLANAGNEAGYFDDSGLWHGSKGFFNSLIPQEGRRYWAGMSVDF